MSAPYLAQLARAYLSAYEEEREALARVQQANERRNTALKAMFQTGIALYSLTGRGVPQGAHGSMNLTGDDAETAKRIAESVLEGAHE